MDKLLRGVDDRVGVLALEPSPRMDPAPGDCDGVDSRRLRRADVERRVADVRRLVRLRVEPLEREQERLRIRLVPLRLVTADDGLEQLAERDGGEGELDGRAALRRDDPETPALVLEAHEDVVHSLAGG